MRIGVESGTAVVGPVGDGDQMRYGAVGEVVGLAAALQSAAKPGTVLVGPATRTAAEEIFEWGPSQDIPVPSGRQPAQRELSRRGAARIGRRGRPSSPGGPGHARRARCRASRTDRCGAGGRGWHRRGGRRGR